MLEIAFNFSLLRYARFLLVSANLSNQMVLKSIFALWNRPPVFDLTRSFNEAIAQYLLVHHFLEHGCFSPSQMKENPGMTECPCCTPESSFAGPLIKVSNARYNAPLVVLLTLLLYASFTMASSVPVTSGEKARRTGSPRLPKSSSVNRRQSWKHPRTFQLDAPAISSQRGMMRRPIVGTTSMEFLAACVITVVWKTYTVSWYAIYVTSAKTC